MSLAMRRLMSVTASTKRAAVTAGKYGTPATNITSLKCLPVDPILLYEGRDLVLRGVLKSPVGLFQTVVVGGQDIRAGDILTVAGQDYNIRLVESWAASSLQGDAYMKLVVEKVKP